MKFCHLHVHSHYSLLDGLAKIDQLIQKAKEYDMPALALTDHGVMYGVIEFYKKAKEANIKPIVGLEAYIAPRSMHEKQGKIDSHHHHLVLLAKNEEGYKNLLKISTISHLEGYYYKPRIDKETLKKYSKGLIALSACLRGEVTSSLLSNNLEQAAKLIKEYQDIFGKDNFYLELQYHPNIPEQGIVNKRIIALGKKIGVPLVATNDIHYVNFSDQDAHEVLLCVQTGKMYDDPNRLSMKEDNFSFKSPEEMIKVFKDVPGAIENTFEIAKKCNLEIELGKFIFPKLDLGDVSPDEKLKALCLENLKKRYPNPSEEVLDRMSYELSVIEKTGFANYMLVVADYTNFAEQKGILTNTRGSAAGSLVSYLVGITNVDPLKYGLLFERFLNVERISWPDVDLDIADRRREELIRYVSEKYGEDRVAQVITFGTIAAKNGIRDTGRVLGMPYGEVDQIAKLIPFGMSLNEALKVVPELKERYAKESSTQKLFNLAKKIEGVARHASVHAAGVVIADQSLTEYVPLQVNTKAEGVITQYEMHALEDVGLVKMDFLGLANLSIIEDALKIIKKTKGVSLDMAKIPLDDPKTYKLLSEGKTSGVFQLESEGMKRYLKELKPSNINDVMAMVALYRPGPMELIPQYIAGKHGRREITYLHPKLEPILAETYGVAVYQEQVLRIAQEICGFTLGQADVLRKAIGKKIKKLLMEQKEKWIDGAVKQGISAKIATKLFEFVEPFARYGFNKAHATSYGMIAYQTAYLKAHFPSEFMAAWMTSEEGRDIDKIAFALQEAQNMDIKVLPPNVNESFVDFGVIQKIGDITYALASIKNVGRGAAETIVEERKKNGKYQSLEDFLKRVGSNVTNKKILESLIKAGALDDFGERTQLLAGIESILKYVQEENKRKTTNQLGLFGKANFKQSSILDSLPQVPPVPKSQKLAWEKELLGMYISEHPLADLGHIWKQSSILSISSLSPKLVGKQIKVAGVITRVQKIITQKGAEMAFIKIEDRSGTVEGIVFPKVFQEANHLLSTDRIVVMKGKVSIKENVLNMLVDQILDINNEQKNNSLLYLIIPENSQKSLLENIKEIVSSHQGETPIVLKVPNGSSWKEVKVRSRVEISDNLLEKLTDLLGASGVEVK